MRQSSAGAPEEGEPPVNPYSLVEAVNASSDAVHTGWLIFIGIMSYVLVAVAGVTHKDLLLARDIPLPILQVGIELTRFFLFAPIVIVLFHVGVITQLVMLARKSIELDGALRLIEPTERRTHPLRLELNHFFFVQAIAGPERSRAVGGLLHGLSWLTLVVLPLLLLVYIQLTFLPYHDVAITWAHRVGIVLDICLLVTIGVFLTRPEQSLAQALWQATLAHPLTVLTTILVLMTVSAFSFLVATVPGERLDMLGRRALTEQIPHRFARGAADRFLLPISIAPDGKLLGLFERNLNVTDLDLVVDKDVTAGEPTLNLRRRDLRYARLDRTDLHQADLTGANLTGASLIGADLRGVLLHCADVTHLLLTDNRQAARCPSAAGANFSRAKLAGANLAGLDLDGARMEEADLTGAQLAHASLVGANLYSARLERADLTGGVSMQGANLATASLQGADLTGAKLEAADLTSTGLQSAILDFASLDGAALRDADLEGASLYQARLLAADLAGARIQAASLREAWIWRAVAPDVGQSGLADLSQLRLTPPTKADTAGLEIALVRFADQSVASRIKDQLTMILDVAAEKGAVEKTIVAGGAEDWSHIVSASRRDAGATDGVERVGQQGASTVATGSFVGLTHAVGSTPGPSAPPPMEMPSAERKARVTAHLIGLACRPRWSSGSVATGVALRALGSAFDGDAGALYEGLKREACLGGKAVAAQLMDKLAAAAEDAREAR